MISRRSTAGVSPSKCTEGMPAARKARAVACECLTVAQKASALCPSRCFVYSAIASASTTSVLMRSASGPRA